MDFLKLLEGGRTALLDGWFSLATHLGEETAFMLFAMIILWCVDKRKGYYLFCIGALGGAVNTLLKIIYCIPRPWVRDPAFTIVESARKNATGYSFPSGHTQTATGLYGGIARVTDKPMLRCCMILVVLVVSFSRLYLGVHTPADVSVSLAVGTALVFLFWPLFRSLPENAHLAYLALSAAAFLSLMILLHAEFAPFPADAIAEISFDGVTVTYKMFGCTLALLVAFWIDDRFLRYSVSAPLPVQLIKCGLGLALVIAIRTFLKAPLLALFSGHPAAGFVRYFLITIFAAAVWPAIFQHFPSSFSGKAAEGA